jgi:hypothetical protein
MYTATCGSEKYWSGGNTDDNNNNNNNVFLGAFKPSMLLHVQWSNDEK